MGRALATCSILRSNPVQTCTPPYLVALCMRKMRPVFRRASRSTNFFPAEACDHGWSKQSTPHPPSLSQSRSCVTALSSEGAPTEANLVLFHLGYDWMEAKRGLSQTLNILRSSEAQHLRPIFTQLYQHHMKLLPPTNFLPSVPPILLSHGKVLRTVRVTEVRLAA